jgi:putative ATPase
MEYHYLSAVSAGVADARKVITAGENNRSLGKQTLLFLDEIHRFNKAQQDAVLGAVESGDIVLIGATTENPSFSVISPLLSRTRVLKLGRLSEESLGKILDNAIKSDHILKE